jgi:molybdate transport system substrate-binding protein
MNKAKTLHVISGGAAQGLVRQLQPQFEGRHGVRIEGTFGAVGAMKDRLLGGAPCDVLILTQALIDELTRAGHVVEGSARAVGRVDTGLALKSGAAPRDVGTPEALRDLLASAQAIYAPDTAKATAGIHFLKVLRDLGLAERKAAQLRTFPNGAAAMGELARSAEADAVGCTQVTEILYTPGVQLIGVLPPPYELATTYTAAVCARAQDASAAQALVDKLCSDEAAVARQGTGFRA